MRTPVSLACLGALALGVVACSTNPTSPASRTIVASVVPAGGSVAVLTSSPIMVTFSNAMQMGMPTYAALHMGSVTGPVVAGTWMWSGDRTRLTFTPTMQLQPHTTYTLHMGGGMLDTNGAPVDYQSCVDRMGGVWATPAMMGGGMMGDPSMMGQGWKGANGMYGMTFAFTTA